METRKLREYKDAKEYARSLGLKSCAEWIAFCKSGRRPMDIPADPRQAYGSQFLGWATFLGKQAPDA